MLVGSADLLVSLVLDPDSEAKLKAESDASLGGFGKNADKAGKDAGEDLRTGVKDGSKGIEGDLAQAGVVGGTNLREGVGKEADKLGDDLEEKGDAAGSRMSKGVGKGLEKLSDLAANTGLPIGGLSSKLDDAGRSLQDADHKSSSLGSSLDKLGGVALVGVGAAAAVVGVATVKLAEGMQTADASIASVEGTSTKFAKTVGDSFLSTAGKSEFTGEAMAKAFAEVAGQLKSTEGHVLSTAESEKFMAASSALAEAKQISLGEATGSTAKVLQAYELDAGHAAHVTDVLYQTSNATGLGVEQVATQLTKLRSKLGETSGSIGETSGLLVDMTDHGVTGRAAMTGLNSGLNTLLKSSDGVATAASQQNAAYEAMTPQLKRLAKEYESGAVTSEQFKKATEGLPPQQATLAENFAKASTAVQTAQIKYKEMGLTVFDAQGKFVGMASIIDQLGPKFNKMTQQQQLATAATLFGAGAARQMVAVIDAGPQAYDKATKSVEMHGAAEAAAKKQSETLHGEEKILGAEVVDVGTKIGEILVPAVTKMTGVFVSATTYVLQHKEILIALAAVVTGVLGTAITVFTINKMAAFGRSFVTAGETVKAFASKVVASMGTADAGIEGTATVAATAETEVATSTGQMELNFEAVGTAAGVADTEVGAAMTGMVGEVEAGDTAIEGANVAAGASFTAMLAPIAAVVGALVAGYAVIKGVEAGLKAITGEASNVSELLGGGQPGESGKEGSVGFKGRLANIKAAEEDKGASSNHRGSLTGKGGRQEALENEGLSATAAAGVIAAYGAEGGTPTAEDPKEGAYGLAQWTDTRKEALAAFAASKHESISSEKAQLEFTAKEIKERGELGQLNAAKSPKEAADLFIKSFERPESPATVEARVNAPGTTSAAGTGTGTTSTGAVSETKAAEAKERETAKELKAEEAAKKAALDKEVKSQESALDKWVSKSLAQEAKVGAVRGAAIAQEVTEHKAYIADVIKEEKAGATEKQATQKAQAKQEASEQETGEKERTKLTTAVQSGSLSQLNSALTKTHAGALMQIEGKLQSTHKAGLEKLTSELVKTWQQAETKKASLEKEAATTAAKTQQEQWTKSAEEATAAQIKQWEATENAEVAALNKASAIAADTSAKAAQGIEDATRISLDKSAEVGLSGAELTTAKAQTSLDEITATNDAAIKNAELHSAEVSGSGKVAEAQAASALQTAQSTAALQQAQAKATVELDKAAQTGTGSGAYTGGINITIYGGNANAQELLGEVGWSIRTGALPTPPPMGIPA